MTDGQPVPGSLYIYAPNKGAPIFFIIAFAVSAAGHFWQCYRYKSFRLLGLHPLCAVLFTVGYAMREWGAFNYIYDEDNLAILIVFILSQVFIYVCPPLLELANYHVLGRILYYVPYLAPLPPGRVLSIFGGLMVLVETLNALGVALYANPTSSAGQQKIGGSLTIAALVIQLVVILIFIVLAGVFHRRCSRAGVRPTAIRTPLITLYVSMALIFVRCVYRLIEHTGNTKVDLDDPESLKSVSPILRYEYFFYIFEATLMLLNSVLWNVWNPGRFLPGSHRVHLDADGKTEVVEEEVPDERPLYGKVLNVVTFGMAFRRERGFRPVEGRELGEYALGTRSV